MEQTTAGVSFFFPVMNCTSYFTWNRVSNRKSHCCRLGIGGTPQRLKFRKRIEKCIRRTLKNDAPIYLLLYANHDTNPATFLLLNIPHLNQLNQFTAITAKKKKITSTNAKNPSPSKKKKPRKSLRILKIRNGPLADQPESQYCNLKSMLW